MSRTAKLRISSWWRTALRIVSNMSRPLSGSSGKCGGGRARGEGAPPLGWGEAGSFRTLGFHLGGLRTLGLLGEDIEHGAGRREQKIQIEHGKGNERAGDKERIQRELCHLGVPG